MILTLFGLPLSWFKPSSNSSAQQVVAVEFVLEWAQEQPLVPAVVIGLAGRDSQLKRLAAV